MTAFYVTATLITLMVIIFLVRPLLTPPSNRPVSGDGVNAAIYRDHMATLNQELSQGIIDQMEYDTALDELQRRLLEDTESSPIQPPSARKFWSGPRTGALISLVIVLTGFGVYSLLGQPEAIAPELAQRDSNDQMEEMISTLAERLKADPNNPAGWAMLARSYKVMGQFTEAQSAFEKAGSHIDSNPDLLVDYAEVLAARADYHFEGQPHALIRRALALDPQHPTGLMLSGMAAFRQSNYTDAITEWEKLIQLLEPDSPDRLQVEAGLSEARVKAGQQTGSSTAAKNNQKNQDDTVETINQMVERLAERLKKTPDDQAGWARLALAYKVQDRLKESEMAYIKAGSLVERDPDLLSQYADLLATRAGGQLDGRPLALINQALMLNPRHPVALMMAGSAAFQRRDYPEAVTHWELAASILPEDSPDAKLVATEIHNAKRQIQGQK